MGTLSHVKSLLALTGLIVCLTVAAAQESKVPDAQGQDEEAIRRSVRQMEAGWNKDDGAQFAKPFDDGADCVAINGRHLRGRANIGKDYRQVFGEGSILNLSVKQIRHLRPDTTLVHVLGVIEAAPRRISSDVTEVIITKVIITLVMTRAGEEWRIAALQNTRVGVTQSE